MEMNLRVRTHLYFLCVYEVLRRCAILHYSGELLLHVYFHGRQVGRPEKDSMTRLSICDVYASYAHLLYTGL